MLSILIVVQKSTLNEVNVNHWCLLLIGLYEGNGQSLESQ